MIWLRHDEIFSETEILTADIYGTLHSPELYFVQHHCFKPKYEKNAEQCVRRCKRDRVNSSEARAAVRRFGIRNQAPIDKARYLKVDRHPTMYSKKESSTT